jgi:CRISPR type I-E-associated protein CasB/Cse2
VSNDTTVGSEKFWGVKLREHLSRVVRIPSCGADLRASLGLDPAAAHRAHRHVALFVPHGRTGGAYERAVYLTSAIAAHHPQLLVYDDRASIGTLVGLTAPTADDGSDDASFARLQSLCRGDSKELARRVPGLVTLCIGRGSHLDLAQLAWDVSRWDTDRDAVVKRWVRDYSFSRRKAVPEEEDGDVE